MVGDYELLPLPDARPRLYVHYRQHAVLIEELDFGIHRSRTASVAVRHAGAGWPFVALDRVLKVDVRQF